MNRARRRTAWDLGNKILYDLCERYPHHRAIDQITAKVWLVGRSDAAPVDRREKNTEVGSDAFYITCVAPAIRNARIDEWLAPLRSLRVVTTENFGEILSVHARLTNLLSDLAGRDQRSFASKYLHFHFRDLFFLNDTRAGKALSLLRASLVGKRRPRSDGDADTDYRKLCEKCLIVRRRAEELSKPMLTPRQIDNLLLDVERRHRAGVRVPSRRLRWRRREPARQMKAAGPSPDRLHNVSKTSVDSC